MYINDLPCYVFYCDLLMYVDDVQLYFSGKQNELMKIADTCKDKKTSGQLTIGPT